MKILLKVGGILASMVFITQTAAAQDHPNDGMYFGVDASYDLLKDNTDLLGTTISFDGPAVGGFVGYRQTKNNLSVAVEARYGYGFASWESGAVLKATHEFELAVLPGYWINDDILLYTRLGATNNTIRVSLAGSTDTNTSTEFNYGAGVEINLLNNLSLRAEYTRSELYDEQTSDTTWWRIKRDRFKVAMVAQF